MIALHTFGDSILDCGRYNPLGIHPGQLLVTNDDARFPEFRGHDLASRGGGYLVHRAVDGATVAGLAEQARGLPRAKDRSIAIVTIGGNDLLTGLVVDEGRGVLAFEAALDRFVAALPVDRVLLGDVYDPTFGDDSRSFLGDVDVGVARKNFGRVNDAIANVAHRRGELVHLHRHFLRGDPSWMTQIIEPSLRGASEVRAAFLPAVTAHIRAA